MTKKVLCNYKVKWVVDAATSRHSTGYIKTSLPGRLKMNFVTYNNIRLKCYINFLYMAPHEVVGSPMLAKAINFFYRVSNILKKNYLFLATYSEINSITISLIVWCFLAAIIFRSVFNSSSIVICNFDSVIFLYLPLKLLVSCIIYLCLYVFILLCYLTT